MFPTQTSNLATSLALVYIIHYMLMWQVVL